jgi:Zn-dependent protease
MNVTVAGAVIFIVILLLSMSIHEMMHAFAADYLGDDTARLQGRLSINPVHHIDPLFTIALPLILYLSGSPFLFGAAKPVQVNFNRLKYDEFGGAIVGAVGPLTNLVIACIAAAIFNLAHPAVGGHIYEAFKITVYLNIGLFIFNSIPWPPLDGSRVLYAFAPEPLQAVMASIERLGMLSILILIFLVYPLIVGPLSNIYSGLIQHLAPGLV